MTLQSLTLTQIVFLLGFACIPLAFFFWLVRKAVNAIQRYDDFTEGEKSALGHQMYAVLATPILVVLIFYAPLFGPQIQTTRLWILFVLGFGMFVYIALSSIKNRVSMFWGYRPVKGAKAVWAGTFLLASMLASLMYLFFFQRQ